MKLPWQQGLLPHLLIFALGLGYCLPWLHNNSAGLALSAYDLAEWSSLHPAVRSQLIMGTPGLLRSVMACLILIAITLLGRSFPRPTLLLLVFVGTLALLPPVRVLPMVFRDINYAQQLGIAVGTLLLGIGAVIYRNRRSMPLIVYCLIAGISTVVGAGQAQKLYEGLGLSSTLGPGPVITLTALSILVLVSRRQ